MRLRHVTLGLILVLVAAGRAVAQVSPGDMNCDGTVDGLDVPLFVDCVLNGHCDPCGAELEMVTIGNPGNAPDVRYGTPGRGGVPYTYDIGKHEVTVAQYTEFLNAVAATNTYGLYNPNMADTTAQYGCNIQQSGSPGGFTYTVGDGSPTDVAAWGDRPVNFVGWGDAARYANWLHNGKPTGEQDLTTTEDGSYFLNGATNPSALLAVVREPDATWVIPSEDEWYKAAYHKNDGVTGAYFDYPTRSDDVPSNDWVDPDPGNHANYYQDDYTIGSPCWRTKAGEFENSGSPYGTFDQCGNVLEWTETVLGSARCTRGGSFGDGSTIHAASFSTDSPNMESGRIGFRVCDVSLSEQTGACCYENGVCLVLTEADCPGTWQGAWTDCTPNPCPPPIRPAGYVVGWGIQVFGGNVVGDFVAVAGGDDHSLGLKADGSIVAWGRDNRGQCSVPAPNADFVAVAAGGYHSLGLKADGTIVAWGYNTSGQCDVPAPNTDFVAITAGSFHNLGLKADGSVVAWGANSDGQCDVPAPNADFVAVAAGGLHSLGLKSDGSIVAWGSNSYGQCDVPAPNAGFVAVAANLFHSLGLKADGTIVAWGDDSGGLCDVPAPNADFVAVAAGRSHSLGVKSDGSIVAWGYNSDGQCDVPAPNVDFVAVSAGWQHSLGVKADGSVVAWGRNGDGQCGVPAPNADFVAVSAGQDHNLGLKTDGSIAAWGTNGYGQCEVPVPNADFVAVAAGVFFSVGLKDDGSVVAWGYNDHGQCDVPAPNADFIAVAARGSQSLGLKADGMIVAWGDNEYGQCDVPSPNVDFVAVAAGSLHSLGLKADGTIVAWGDNGDGQCDVPSPNADFVAVAAGVYHSVGLKDDGSVVAWGDNLGGQCDVPPPNTDFVAIVAGSYHSLGLKTDGSIVAWGSNYSGPCDVPPPNADFVAIAAGYYYSVGVRAVAEPPGACCHADGTCLMQTEAECAGVWQGAWTDCVPNPCPQPIGACCYPYGACLVQTEVDCGGEWQGAETTCSPNPCLEPVLIETVTVGNPGNAGELSGEGAGGYGPLRSCGAVAYAYDVGRYEVTAGQYTAFLNAVAVEDMYGLYNANMGSSADGCKIERAGAWGSYMYRVADDWADRPVNYVSYWDACRFANWLHNGQPTGVQGEGTTEAGAYTLNGYNGDDGRTIQRNSGWLRAVTSEDERYKAACHKNDGVTGNYWDYPMSSSTSPNNGNPGGDTGNTANYNDGDYTIGSPYWRTIAGTFGLSDSPYGTLDQGGNAWEWNESIVLQVGSYAYRGWRGGAYSYNVDNLRAAVRNGYHFPTHADEGLGFRVSKNPALVMGRFRVPCP